MFASFLVFPCELTVRVMNYPPLAIKDAQSNWSGLDVDYTKALLDKVSCKYKFIEAPFARGLALLKSGGVDLSLNISFLKERASFLHYIGPQRIETIKFVSRQDNISPIETWDEFLSLHAVLIRQRGTHIGNKIETAFKENIYLKKYLLEIADNEAMIDLLNKKRIDGFFIESSYLAYQQKENPQFKNIYVHPIVINQAPVYFAFSKRSISKEQIDALNIAFVDLNKSGVFKDIEMKYQLNDNYLESIRKKYHK